MASQELLSLDREPADGPRESRTAAEIEAWLVSQLSELLGIAPSDIDVRQPFTYYGLSSAEAAILAGDLEDWLGCELSPTLAWDYPTIEALASHLAGEMAIDENQQVKGVSRIQAVPRTSKNIDQLLAELDQLSEDEVQRILDDETQSSSP